MSKDTKKQTAPKRESTKVAKPERVRKEDLKRLEVDADVKAGGFRPGFRCTSCG